MELKEFKKLKAGDFVRSGKIKGKIIYTDQTALLAIIKTEAGKKYLKNFKNIERHDIGKN